MKRNICEAGSPGLTHIAQYLAQLTFGPGYFVKEATALDAGRWVPARGTVSLVLPGVPTQHPGVAAVFHDIPPLS